MTAPGVSRYDHYGRLERAVLITCAAGLVVLSAGLVVAPVRSHAVVVHGLGVILLPLMAFFLARVLRFATIDLSGDFVIVRGLLSTARFRLADVERFTVASGFDQSGQPKSALSVLRPSGETRVFPDFSSREEPGRMPVRELARRLNDELDALRISMGFGAA